MKIDEIRVTAATLAPATPADVDGLESRLWIAFPEGYRDYVTRLGEGSLGSFVRIYPPWRIEAELDEWRRRIAKYWFWDEGPVVLPKERALECVIVGDTTGGDELVFHPTRPDRLFVLPRDSEQVFEAGAGLLAAVEWMCTSGELVEDIPGFDFEPFDSRLQTEGEREPGAADPEGESLDDLIDLGKRWAKRHEALKAAQKEAKSLARQLTQQFGKERTSTLVYEAIVIEGKHIAYNPGYAAVFRIDDKASRLEVGTFTWQLSGDSQGGAFSPNHANLAKLAKPGGDEPGPPRSSPGS